LYKKRAEIPFFVERIAVNMKGKPAFAITPSMELILKGGQSMINSPLDEFSWGDDPETAMLVQFDRLPSEMQLILRTASVIGQTFSMDVVAEVLGEGYSLMDCFFIVTSYPDARGFVSWDETDEDREQTKNFKMSFKSAVLQKCIYSAMLTEQRQDIHYRIATKYQSQLEAGDKQASQLLPLIAYHYGQSKDFHKKIESLDKVSSHYVENGAYSEAIAALEKLFELQAQEERKTERNPRIKRNNLSRWNMLLGISYVGRSEWSKGQKHLYEALSFLDFEFPNSRFQMKLTLFQHYMEQKRHWRRRQENKPTITDETDIDRMQKVCGVLNALHTCFTFIGDGKSAELCLLMQLNFCESLGTDCCKKYNLHFGQIEAAVAMLFWMRDKRSLSLEYFARAKTISEYSESDQDLQTYYSLRATMLLSSGKIKEAIESMHSVAEIHQKRTRENASSHSIHIEMAMISMLDGNFEQHHDDLVSVYEMAVDNSDDSTQVEAACVMIQSLLLAPPHFPEGITDVSNWIPVIEGSIESWSDARSSILHLLNISASLFFYYSFKSPSKSRTYSELFLNCLERARSRLRSPLGYLVTIYILCYLLALHRVHVNMQESNQHKEGWKGMELTNGVTEAINALTILKKWWSFATPILWLAEGLAQVFKGKYKKAASAWRKGILRTDEMENLKMLKAILQVRVVRYSRDNDATKLEVTEFLQRVGARTELALVAGEEFSPLPTPYADVGNDTESSKDF